MIFQEIPHKTSKQAALLPSLGRKHLRPHREPGREGPASSSGSRGLARPVFPTKPQSSKEDAVDRILQKSSPGWPSPDHPAGGLRLTLATSGCPAASPQQPPVPPTWLPGSSSPRPRRPLLAAITCFRDTFCVPSLTRDSSQGLSAPPSPLKPPEDPGEQAL